MKQEWQPIEIAPKDGTAILGFWQAWGASHRNYGITFFMKGEWIDSGSNDIVCRPTYWQPLPEPPKEKP